MSDVLGLGHDSGKMQSHVLLYRVETEVTQEVAHRHLDSQGLLVQQSRHSLFHPELVVGGVDFGRRDIGEEHICQAGELGMGGVAGARA